ncbi:hypothetical protein [Pseudoduganella rivuli]|uniref:hypothetical protein n=1 Tax=Pseudoduganella rivuli TaxID=2666085 RepID=UPI001E64DC4A|nr:hypothetical protein [Pseudoduganella rivuli]
MNKHSHKSNQAQQATAHVPPFGRVAVGALVVSCTLLAAAAPAHAFGPGDREPPRREERDTRDNRSDRERERDNRAFERAEERRRIMQESGNSDMSRRVDRMTADERRDLRRQINEAGQEIYVRPQRR